MAPYATPILPCPERITISRAEFEETGDTGTMPFEFHRVAIYVNLPLEVL